MRAIDTNVLVRLIMRDDPRQTALAESYAQGGAWASVLAMTEAGWVLSTIYNLSAGQLATAIEMLLNHRDLVVQDQDTVTAALDLFPARPSLGFSDCLILQLARSASHLPLGTCDRNLGKVARAQKL